MKPILLTLTVLAVVGAGSVSANDRIVGGQFASKGDFPHQVAVLKNERFSCGGSVVHKQWVLTAAHCVRGQPNPKAYVVVHGSSYWPNGTYAKVSAVVSHEQFGDFKNDVALLKLAKPLVFDEFTNAVPLFDGEVPAGAPVVISGFGRVIMGGEASPQLKYNEMKAVSDTECAMRTGIRYDGLICFNGPVENGACNGDSGGPAVYDGKLVGVANLVLGGCGSSNPDVYAKVSYFVDWIQKHTEKPVLKFL